MAFLTISSLGGLHKSCGNIAPIEIKNKKEWIEVERLRWARQFQIPMSEGYPKGFPKPVIHLQRFLTSVWLDGNQKPGNQEMLVKVVDKLWETLWTKLDAGDVSDPKVFARILAPVLGEDVVKRHVEASVTPEVKKQLIQNTELSFKEGAFGLPWYKCENPKGEVEGFWGFDHLGQVTRFMDLDGKNEIRALL